LKKFSLLVVVVMACAGPAHADTDYGHDGLFANAKEIFRPLLADPRELQLALRLTTPVSHTNLGDIAVGDYFGLYRWALPWKDSYVQWSVGAGVFARFDLVDVEKTSEVIDYSVSMPVDVRLGTWTTRLMPYHISSHLGDDYIKQTGILPDKYSFDSFKWLIADDPFPFLRLYTGYNYIIRNRQQDLGRHALQAGAECTSGWWAHGHAQLFWANDFQSWERVGWNPSITTQLGVRLAHDPKDKQTLSIFTEYGAGHLAYGQLFQTKESHWVAGLRFELP
jgi:Protein of unknown function (DUF1207)